MLSKRAFRITLMIVVVAPILAVLSPHLLVRLAVGRVYCNDKLIPTAKVYRLYNAGMLAIWDVTPSEGGCFELYPGQNLVGQANRSNYVLFQAFGFKEHDKDRGVLSNDSKYYEDLAPNVVVQSRSIAFNAASHYRMRVEY